MKTNRIAMAVIAVLTVSGCARQTPTVDSPPVAVSEADMEYFEQHPLMVPVDGVSPRDLLDSFNDTRENGRTHRAIDILAPRGTPVVAAIAGEILRLNQNAAGGVTAYLIDDERRYLYYYAHLDHYSDQVTAGLRVPQGFVIGYVGTSGNAPPDTPHLHFQAMRLKEGQRDWWNGTPVDVRRFMTRQGRTRE
ncbi:MAG: M23 family metallopeptidase [Gemmatimonadaceae bacterium]|nr:M23 family metallopeptidase [Gemmatimonadaceae bacterium]